MAMISALWVSRSTRAATDVALRKVWGHWAKARLVVMTMGFFSCLRGARPPAAQSGQCMVFAAAIDLQAGELEPGATVFGLAIEEARDDLSSLRVPALLAQRVGPRECGVRREAAGGPLEVDQQRGGRVEISVEQGELAGEAERLTVGRVKGAQALREAAREGELAALSSELDL